VAEVRLPPEPVLEVDSILEATGKTIKGPRGACLTVSDLERLDDGQFAIRIDLLPAATNANNLFNAIARGRFGGLPIVPELPDAVQAQLQQGCGGALIAPGGAVLADPLGLSLADAQGRRFQLTGVPRRRYTISAAGVVYDLTLVFKPHEGQGQPARLVYSSMRVVTLDIPFVLKDIPLP
jgi:hypothetical protein